MIKLDGVEYMLWTPSTTILQREDYFDLVLCHEIRDKHMIRHRKLTNHLNHKYENGIQQLKHFYCYTQGLRMFIKAFNRKLSEKLIEQTLERCIDKNRVEYKRIQVRFETYEQKGYQLQYLKPIANFTNKRSYKIDVSLPIN